jgi:solute carrier family 10 (sodium/bile acid cotransporter), member 7
VWRAISQHWFLLTLAICLGLGFGLPEVFSALAHNAQLRDGIVFAVMLLMGWTLQPKAVVRSVRQPLPSLLAISINMVGVPLLALPALWLLPQDLAGGLIVASLVPCTLASAAVWTRSAGGDDAIAMVTTVVTNVLCFVVAPVGLWLTLGHVAETDVASQMKGLFFQVVAPLIVGQLLRVFGLAAFADRNKFTLSLLAQAGILAMVLLGSVISAERMSLNPASTQSGFSIFATAIGAGLIHLVAVGLGYQASAGLGIARPQQLGVALAGGQKTLMVGLQLALDCGVSVVPMIMYHVGQLLIDTVLVRLWTRKVNPAEPVEEVEKGEDLQELSQ